MNTTTIYNKYYCTYHNIINIAISKNRTKGDGVYYENHHIIPLSLGGSNDESNLVLLTAREHFICHHLLIKFVDSNKLLYAFWMMSNAKDKNRNYIVTSTIYENTRKLYIEAMTGSKRNKETRRKMRDAALKNMSEERKMAISAVHKGKIVNEETRKAISETRLTIKNYKIKTPHGIYLSYNDAANDFGCVGHRAIRSILGKLDNKINKRAVAASKILSSNDIGKTYREIGFDKLFIS